MNQTEKKKKAILEVTFQLLNDKEIKDITIDEIAATAVVSKVTLFKYFKNKNHLMNIVIVKAFEQMAEDINEIIGSELDFESTYQAITQMKLKQLEHYSPTFSENLMTQYTLSPDFFDADTIKLQMQVYEELFKKGQLEGKIAPTYSFDDFMFIMNIFIEGMKGLTADTLFKRTDLISRYFLQGFK